MCEYWKCINALLILLVMAAGDSNLLGYASHPVISHDSAHLNEFHSRVWNKC